MTAFVGQPHVPRYPMPLAYPGMRIGLFGGSFNPAHDAHRTVSLFARARLGLDRVWWLVSPGNPLKDVSDLPPLAQRIAHAKKMANSPFIEVTGIEAALGARYTIDTVAKLKFRSPGVHLVLVMGADILPEFHRWRRWRDLARSIPFAIIDRPGWTFGSLGSPAAALLSAARLPEDAARSLPQSQAPAWVFLHGLKLPLSSSGLRKLRANPQEG